MNSRIVRIAVVVSIAAGLTSTLSAQESCTDIDTPTTCFQKFNPPTMSTKQAKDQAKDHAQSDTQKMVAVANTGATTLSSPSATALKDFLSFFAASVDSATVSEKGNALTLDWNLPF